MLLTLIAAGLTPAVGIAQEPTITRLEATSLRPGQPASVTVHGTQLAGTIAVWTPIATLRPVAGHDAANEQTVALEGVLSADVVPGIYPVRAITNRGCSEAAWMVIDDLPAVTLTPDADSQTGQSLALPACVEGRIDAVGTKRWRCDLAAGQLCAIEVYARRLGSSLDPVVRVIGPDGHEVAYADDVPAAEGDLRLQFTANTAGEHRIELRDVRYSGGDRHFFHLRIGNLPLVVAPAMRLTQTGQGVGLIDREGAIVGEVSGGGISGSAGASPSRSAPSQVALIPVSVRPAGTDGSGLTDIAITTHAVQSETEPNDDRTTATTIAADSPCIVGAFDRQHDIDWYQFPVLNVGTLVVSARTRELGSPCDLLLSLHDADGKQLGENDDAGQRDAELSVAVPTAGNYFLRVRDLADRGGPGWSYALESFHARRGVRIVVPTDHITVPRGGSASVTATVQQINGSSPLVVEAVNLPAGLHLAPFTVGLKQKDVPLTFTSTAASDSNTDADWGSIQLRCTSRDGTVTDADIQLAPPAPRKQEGDPFRSARLRSDFFAASGPAAQFALTPDATTVSVAQGATATVIIKAARTAEWTEPIEIALTTAADQLPEGITVTSGSMTAGELTVSIAAAENAAVGPFAMFLNGKSKKDKAEPVHPVPAITVDVVTKSP